MQQIIQWYIEDSGYDLSADFRYGIVFNTFRAAIVCQGIAARVALGQGKNQQANVYATMRNALAELAWDLTQEATRSSFELNVKGGFVDQDFEGVRARL
jgi:hypothetical protein